MRVLVCGGRDFNDYVTIYDALTAIEDQRGKFECLITGDAKGVDLWAGSWAVVGKLQHIKFKADWTTHGKGAGPIRNQLMLDEGKPDLVIAFPGGRGTADMVRRAEKAGIEVIHVKKPTER